MAPVTPDRDEIRWTRADLERSLYYPAAGWDTHVLLRFSHLTRRFIMADYACTEEAVFKALQRFPGRLDDVRRIPAERITGPAAIQNLLAADANGNLDRLLLPKNPEIGDLTLEAAGMCRGRLNAARAFLRKAWIGGFKARRIVGSVSRPLEILYLGGEAFAVYDRIFGDEGVAPRILFTVNSGIHEGGGWTELEEPAGIFENFVTAPGRPLSPLRVRGRLNCKRGDLVAPGAKWTHFLQAFQGWGFSTVVGMFSNEPTWPLTDDVTYRHHRTLTIRKEPITKESIRAVDMTFLGPGLGRRFSQHPALESKISVWKSRDVIWETALSQIDERAAREKWKHVVMSPVPFSDEGQLLLAWARAPGYPFHLEIRFQDPLDLPDLRGWPYSHDDDYPAPPHR